MIVTRKNVCKNLADDGLGVRELNVADRTFLKKFVWDIITQSNWGANFLKNYFLKDDGKSCINSTLWPAMKLVYGELRAESRWLPGTNSYLNFGAPTT